MKVKVKINIQEVLKKHSLWLEGDPTGKKANLRGVDLREISLQRVDLRLADFQGACLQRADLLGADLRGACFRGADLRGIILQRADIRLVDFRLADLREANLDFSCLPLWCGGLDFKVDEKIARQMLYHLLNIAQTSNLLTELFTPEIVAEANKFHKVGEVPEIKLKEK
jgi:hypothetical protein